MNSELLWGPIDPDEPLELLKSAEVVYLSASGYALDDGGWRRGRRQFRSSRRAVNSQKAYDELAMKWGGLK